MKSLVLSLREAPTCISGAFLKFFGDLFGGFEGFSKVFVGLVGGPGANEGFPGIGVQSQGPEELGKLDFFGPTLKRVQR